MKMFTHNGMFPRFSRLLAVACVGIFFSTAAQAQEVITIKQAVERMLQNNLNIKQSSLNAATAETYLQQSKIALYPTLNGGLSNNFSFGRRVNPTTNEFLTQNFLGGSADLQTSVDLFNGKAKINQIRQNRILLEANFSALEKTKNDLVLQVVTSYFEVVFNEDFLRASRQQLLVAEQTLKRENALFEAGNKTVADISQAKAQVATAELNVTNAQNQLTISYLTLSQLMEMRSDVNYKVVAPTIQDIATAETNYIENDVYNAALSTYPDIKLARLNSEAAAKGVDVAKGLLYPRISVGAALGTQYSYSLVRRSRFVPDPLNPDARPLRDDPFFNQVSDNFGQSIGLNISIPIFSGLSGRFNVKRAKITHQGNLLQEQLTKNNLNKIIAQAIADVRAARSRYQSTFNTFNAQAEAFRVIEERYNVGLVNSLDYNTSQTNRNNAEIDFIQAKYDLLFRSKVIDFYLGREITF